MTRPCRFIALAIILTLAVPAIGPARKKKKKTPDFIDDVVRWIATKDDVKQWKKLKTDLERKRFEELFWARRDPTPTTRRNEFQEEYERRLAYSDSHFGSGRTRGRDSDRGRVYCLLGSPTRIGTFSLKQGVSAPTGPGGSSGQGGDADRGLANPISSGTRAQLPPILWSYEDLPAAFGIPNLQIRFVDYSGFGSYALDASGTAAGALKMAVKLNLVQPDLEELPVYAEEVAKPVPALDPAVVKVLDAGNPGTLNVGMVRARLDAPDGRCLLQVAVGLTAGSASDPVGFLRVTGQGETIRELPLDQHDDLFVGTVILPPGKFDLAGGILDREGGEAGIKTDSIQILEPSTKLALSSIILAARTETLDEAAPETDPFTFGKLRLIPSLTGSFPASGELYLFVEANHVTETPEQQAELLATYAFDRDGVPWNKIPESPQQTLRLSPGRHLLTQILPLSRFRPATYTLHLTVRDKASGVIVKQDKTFQVD